MTTALAFTIIAFAPATAIMLAFEMQAQSARTAAMRRARIIRRARGEG